MLYQCAMILVNSSAQVRSSVEFSHHSREESAARMHASVREIGAFWTGVKGSLGKFREGKKVAEARPDHAAAFNCHVGAEMNARFCCRLRLASQDARTRRPEELCGASSVCSVGDSNPVEPGGSPIGSEERSPKTRKCEKARQFPFE